MHQRSAASKQINTTWTLWTWNTRTRSSCIISRSGTRKILDQGQGYKALVKHVFFTTRSRSQARAGPDAPSLQMQGVVHLVHTMYTQRVVSFVCGSLLHVHVQMHASRLLVVQVHVWTWHQTENSLHDVLWHCSCGLVHHGGGVAVIMSHHVHNQHALW